MSPLTPSRRILGCAAALAVALLGLTVWTVFEARQTALDQAAVSSRNLAQTLQQHTLQAFQTVDLVLRDLADRLGDADLVEARAALPSHAAGLDQVRYLTMLDAAGTRVADSAPKAPAAIDAAERAALEAHAARVGLGLYIGAPAKSGRDGLWTVALARRLTDPQGRFLGVVIAALDLGYFQAFYDKVEVGPNGGIALFRTDGTLFFRKPFDEANIGRSVADSPAFRDRLLRYPSGTFETTPTLDGITRISSHRQLESYPFVIVTGVALDDVLAAWRQRALLELAAAATLAVIVLCLGVLLDREFRKRAAAEAEARHAARRFERDKLILEAVLKGLPDGTALIDADGRMQLWNDLLFAVLDLDRAAILAADAPARALSHALTARGDDALALTSLAAMPSGTNVQEIRMSTGRWIERRITGVPGVGHVAIYRDIANRKRRELEMQESQARLQAQATTLSQLADDLDLARQAAEAARIEAETASRTKSTFIAGMNHELRTPLNAILGFAQVIHEQRFGAGALERYSEYANHIIASGEHLLSLINDLLDMAKIDAGKMDLEPEPIDIKELLAATLLMVRETAASHGITIRLDAPDGILLSGDPRRLKQCFLNLVSNAVKFTPEGGSVLVSVTPQPDWVEIAVADTGIGVRASDLSKIFEPFGQVDSPLARRHVGTGLGLPLARTLVELHGGDLSFRSVEGSGTTVTVSLPRRRLVA